MKENSTNEKDIHLLESYAGMTHKMTDNQGRPKLDQAIEHILSDYKRVLKKNEELKNQEATQRKINKLLVQRYSNSIPVQKVKDKIEEYKKLSDNFYVKFLESDRYNTDIREKGIKCDAIILALEELIEEREEK